MYRACSRCGKVHDTNYKCNHNRTYKSSNEREVRNKYAWHKKSEDIRRRSKYLCAVCREEKRYTYNNLEVHHIISIKNNKERWLDDTNLICLCQEHHKLAEIGKLDKDYLFELAKKRDDK